MSFAPKQFIRSVDFLSTENAINTSTGCVNIYGGMSVSKDSYLTNMIVVGNSTVANLNITGALTTSNGNTLISSQWTSIDSNTDIYFGTSANAFVGIGTTTPGFNLDISGGSRITGGLTVGNLNVNTGATITNILNTTICTGTILVSGGITTGTLQSSTGNITNISATNITTTTLNCTSTTISSVLFATGGNIGINNTSPIYKFDVNGTTRIINTSATSMGTLIVAGPGSTSYVPSTATSGQLASFYGPSGAGIFSNIDLSTYTPATSALPSVRFSMKDLGSANSDFNILTRNVAGTMASRIYIDGSGNIGINTTNPSVTLDVTGNARISSTATINSLLVSSGTLAVGGVTNFNSYAFSVGVPNNTNGILLSASNNNTNGTLFQVDRWGGGAQLCVRASGNVGIGTTTPANTLDINGTMKAGDITVGNINFTGSLFQNGTAYLGSQWTTTAGNTLTYTSGNVSINSGFTSTFNSNTLGNIFTTGGNVGINTTSPSRLLHLRGDALRIDRDSNSSSFFLVRTAVSDYSTLWKGYQFGVNANGVTDGSFFISDLGAAASGSGTQRLLIDNTGNIGIGTTTPTSKLQVHATDFPNIKLTTDNVFVNSIDLDSTNKTGGVYWRLMSTHQDASEGQGKFVISQVTSGINVLALTSSGNVGIRTLNPSTTLDVSGTGRITTSLTTGALFSTNQTSTNIVGTNMTVTNMNSSTNTIGTLNATGITTSSLLSTNGVLTNATITNMNSSTNTIGTLNATGITTASLLATSASVGNISAGSINLSGNLNIAGTLTVVNVTTTNLTMSNGNALLNLVTSGTILNTGTITSGPLMLRTPNNYDGRILTLSTLTVGNAYNLTLDAVSNTTNNVYWSLGQNTLSSTYANMLTFYGGNVGINTTQASSKFVVADSGATKGHLKLVSNTGATEDNWWLGFCHVDSSDSNDRARIGVKIQGGGAGRLFFTTGGFGSQAERMTIDASGNVGIGTTSPGAKLQIDGPAGTGTNGSVVITGYDSYGHSLYIGSYAVQKRLAFNHNGTTGNIFAYDYGAVAARNLVLQGPGGNVGIGASSPSRLLSLSGPSSNIVNGPHIWINTSDSPVNPVFQQLNWSADNISMNFDMYYDGAFRNSGSSVAWQIYKSNSQLRFMLQNGTAGSSNGQFNAMVLGSTGNVGIGNPSTPAYILDVAGTTRITNTSATSMGTLIVAGPGSASYTPSTATSGQLASFYGPGGAGIFSHIDFGTFLPGPTTNNQPAVRFSMKDLGSANSDFNILTRVGTSTGTMASRIFIDGSGNVGIGNTSPSQVLEVYGNSYTRCANNNGTFPALGSRLGESGLVVTWNSLSNTPGEVDFISLPGLGTGGFSFAQYNSAGNLWSTSSGSLFRITGSGNVGISTNAPVSKLHVVMGDVTAAASPSFWDSTYAVFGQASNTGGAVGLGYSSASGGCLLSLSPNVAWQPMTYRGSNHQFIVSGTIGTSPTLSVNATQVLAATNTNGEGLLKIGNTNAGSSAYSILRIGNNVNDAVIFLNSSARTTDGGASTLTIRNDAGALRLQASSATGTIWIPSTGTNIGLNTTSPRATLELTQTSTTTGMMLYSGSDDAGVNRIIFNHSATTSNYQKVSIETQALGAGQMARSHFSIRVNTANDNSNVAAGDTRVFIHGTSGNVGIMTTSPSYTLQVAGDIYATGDVISFSDARLKTDVQTINNALDKVSNMRGVYYTNLNTQTRETGVIAQEIMDVLPEVVADRGEYLGVAYGNIVGVLIEAIKELKARVAELENR